MSLQLIWVFSDLWTHKSLNAHINFHVIVRLSPFYSQSTIHWMPISTSQSLFVFLCFTLSTRVTECPYQLPSHLSSIHVLLSVNMSLNVHINFPVIVRLSLFYSQSTTLWMPISTSHSLFVSLRWYGHSVTCGLRVKRWETTNDREVDMGLQWIVDWE
jgi:hypothetical protein